ncbi:hypothetical protein PR202_ga21878 [Eleusine coracana subsp. coracana]|uniref:VWFA domain-containing protein n=1 Tax=Eleusine coracana subsp. coracana TaxID=191504 RepID=A0AAV5D267_ELECO|nr:hypothetical protein QOZ80_9AG0681630 [Eleusine coracana subsp. coracana]GJN04335.1 hypothetical protein PR202_ga21878 [Eleusine coracana subsp. coracana]
MFNDDEKPIAPAANAGRPALGFSDAGKASVKADHSKEAPLAATTVSVLLDVSSSSSTIGRAPLDLVVVLDVSGSMRGPRLDQLKSAMQFVIKKLSPMDRLSIVTFSTKSDRPCALRAMSDAAKSDLKGIIDRLVARGGTNIQAGLETGLHVLSDRQFTDGRTANVLLMSDGEQNHGDARQVTNPRAVPVYSLAFGADADMNLLRDLAMNGGTFNPVPETGNTGMLAVFSQLMAGLLTVIVQDLYLILSKPTSPDDDLDKIVKVAPGDFYQETDKDSVTVKFGDLFSGEVRKVVVDLLLVQATGSDYEADMLEVAVSYPDSKGIRQKFRGQTLHITRSGTATSVRTTPKLVAENARRQHAESIGAARSLADDNNLDDARDKLVEAQNALEDILDQANPMVAMLRTELQQLLDRMESPELYRAEGKAYALAAEMSHARQRFASRGDVEGVRLFATPRMDAYLEQAKKFAENPDAPVPTADEDAEEEVKANPMAVVAGSLAFYIRSAVEALQAIEKIVTATAAAGNN